MGQSTVYHESSPIWAICYAGGVTEPVVAQEELAQVYDFLRAALRRVTPERPYRGPRVLREGPYIYTDESEGDIERFSGEETITRSGKIVYRLRYHGGVLR